MAAEVAKRAPVVAENWKRSLELEEARGVGTGKWWQMGRHVVALGAGQWWNAREVE